MLAISRKIHQFYQKMAFPTLGKLLVVLNHDMDFKGFQIKTLQGIEAFKIQKQTKRNLARGRKFLIGRPEITHLHHQFLREMEKGSETSSKIIYLHET